mmetsp:Transcript_28850/g.43569  ORF Transcript_28850/g.43569 Transcript_28850/m.43569 type:complete len:143 (+) Transcript_28850:1336-1764(+)|eukprot:CAMPEP_0170488610 /NCGR_PEP_ID=MMETSP0208-20121228/7126_1 /TAXON_ID=197538 /ORGANISM="Strombidium inclinatum, Strain S3" /LENGTH=142 /DNA_ID=CAMNT_0010763239 /DNA_START=1287 /DNA_END=1715 /DNA_ORIENTATION=-
MGGLNFGDGSKVNYAKLAKLKPAQLIKQMQALTRKMSDERQKLKLLCLYVLNYKIKTEKDFKLLKSMVDEAKFPYAHRVLDNLLRLSQADMEGEVFSKGVSTDKFDRLTPYLSPKEIMDYKRQYEDELGREYDITKKKPLLL